ncbi:extra-large guanine nucleotide-binding protein 1-like isoform X3 [Malania oleifera]|uniref:extra-large guanine nucleotide-binding protein 1-like isoform X3 n=1 Tax=Malania oleifera TaxID=397392 RepID=UPI0025AE0D66|nr:extra-large guanine nucleotide-binding protein 1-like isoform X3 [Malania oleifera]
MRKILPIVPPTPEEDDDNIEYSFAAEYCGPPVSHNIPQAVPINVQKIPVAAAVAAASVSNNLSLPVIQPIVKRGPLSKKLSKESRPRLHSISANPETLLKQRVEDSHGGVLSNELVCYGKVKVSNGHDMSCKPSNAIDDMEALGSTDKCNHNVSDGTASSTTSCFSNSHDNSHESVESSDALGLPENCKQSAEFQQYLTPANWVSTESAMSSRALSSEISSCDRDDSNNETPCNIRTSVVTFHNPELGDMVHEVSGDVEAEISQERQSPERTVRKGSCYRCLKGNRFTKKEACLVCNAKYCKECVLRAMGSMPEGRKCVTCIGYSINESKQGAVGKCSRLLKQLLTELELKQIMKAERLCEANQMEAERVCVNGKPLSQEEMLLLRSCSNPPKKLKPGNYWYDKVCGFWGKEGQKPCQIITPNLNVGDSIKRNASNGNTNILINNREITNAEVFMLKAAGVHCAGKTSFWVSADGSCLEEGQKNDMGPIWDKSRTKVVCAIFSLPIPPEPRNRSGEEVNGLINGNVPSCLQHSELHKLFLVGCNGSGTSTMYKQAKILYHVPFSEDERQNIKLMIQSNLYGYVCLLLEWREQFEEESLSAMEIQSSDQPGPSGNVGQVEDKTIYSIGSKLKKFSDWLLKVKASGNLESTFPAAAREYAPLVVELWKDAAIQATCNRRKELQMLPSAANYFLDRAVEISRTDYEPSDLDILYAEGITSSNGLACMEFTFPKSAQDESNNSLYQQIQHDSSLRYQLIRVHPKNLGENCKRLEMFEDIEIALFCVALTNYSQFFDDVNGISTNKMLESKKLFEKIVTHSTFSQKHFLLILNKFDLLEEIIEQVPLTRCEWFHDFNPVISLHHNSNRSVSNGTPLAQHAFHYIASKFKRLFYMLTGRKLYVSLVTGLEPDTVDDALRYAREILKWDEEKPNFSFNESSSYSMEETTSSS